MRKKKTKDNENERSRTLPRPRLYRIEWVKTAGVSPEMTAAVLSKFFSFGQDDLKAFSEEAEKAGCIQIRRSSYDMARTKMAMIRRFTEPESGKCPFRMVADE